MNIAPNSSRLCILVCAIVVCVVAGCSEKPATTGEPVYPVSGVVRFQGKPVALAMVVFHSAANPAQKKSYAKTATDGSFALTTFEPQDGAPPGKYVITITWPPTEDEETPGLSDKLGGRYANAKQSKLSFEVKAEPNVVPTIELQ